MSLPHRLSMVIQKSHSLGDILNQTVQLVAEEMQTDVASIYLLDPHTHKLELRATHGLAQEALGKVSLESGEGLTGIVVEQLRSLAVEDAAAHPGYRYFPETQEEEFHSFLGVPLAIRARPVGALVVQTREERTYSEHDVHTLTTIAAQLVGIVENARLIDALDRGHEGANYLVEVREWQSGTWKGSKPLASGEVVLDGTAIAPGIAIGSALVCGSGDVHLDLLDRPFEGADTERSYVKEAFRKTLEEVSKLQVAARRETDDEHALIFSSHLLLLNDPVIHERIERSIAEGIAAPIAVYAALEQFAAKLRGVTDPYLQERVEDIIDLRTRLVSHLASGVADESTKADKIVVSTGLAPSLVVELKAEGARGLITVHGGSTSHGALLARSLGIPAVSGLDSALGSISTGSTLIVDGDTGKVILSPTATTLRDYEKKLERVTAERSIALKFSHVPARTQDGSRVRVLANISLTADLKMARDHGAEGVGLFRTEFPFLVREGIPDEEEQARTYTKVFDYFDDVWFRLLDLGGDKLMPGNTLQADRNPFRGYRSLRLLLRHPEILQRQVRAFARAADGQRLQILIPMVGSLTELRRTKELIFDALQDAPVERPPRLGAMIEVPGAVEIISDIVSEVDYLSIGSNDLTQFYLAVDRENEKAASDDDPYHPAVLRAIDRVIGAAADRGVAVSLCGEIASVPTLALLLVALGIDALSVAPGAIPETKRLLASSDVRPLKKDAKAILERGVAAEIKAALAAHLPDDFLTSPLE